MPGLLEGLNQAQREAVESCEGPLLVIAGPGSGKTRVITHRIAHMILEHGISPRSILAVTFTNKAADEMRRRLADLVVGPLPAASTFHRFCARVLRQFSSHVARTPQFSILDQNDRGRLLSTVMRDAGLDLVHFPPDRVERRISQLKNDLISPEEFAERTHDAFDEVIAKAYPEFQRRMTEMNAVDFDDLLYLVAQLLRTNPDVRRQLDATYKYLLVDEYQDTNLAQYAIARGLSVDYPNLCVTGDPDQSIYSWRGANLSNILSFESDFPGARIVRLEQNYRSTGNILAVADHLIRHNSQRKHKDLHTENEAGPLVSVVCHQDDAAEAGYLAESIRQAVDEGHRGYQDFAVFVRTMSLTRTFEQAFRLRHIPFQVIGGISFFERKEIRDVLAYARLVLNPRDDTAFERIVNVPPRGIGETTLKRLRTFAVARSLCLSEACRYAPDIPGVRAKQAAGLLSFRILLDELAGIEHLPPAAAIDAILDRTGYREFLAEDVSEDSEDRRDHVEGLVASAQDFGNQEPDADLTRFLETVSLHSDSDERDEFSQKVSIMTLHAAKGLEFPVVALVAFEHGILPHERAVREGNEEEERRLAFVGITRAREELTISYVRRRSFLGRYQGSAPSPFLLELPRNAIRREDLADISRPAPGAIDDDYSQESGYDEPSIQVVRRPREPSPSDRYRCGMRVVHPNYGPGVILQLEGIGEQRKATIHFASAGVRRFVLCQTPLTIE